VAPKNFGISRPGDFNHGYHWAAQAAVDATRLAELLVRAYGPGHERTSCGALLGYEAGTAPDAALGSRLGPRKNGVRKVHEALYPGLTGPLCGSVVRRGGTALAGSAEGASCPSLAVSHLMRGTGEVT
jgi:hypothetical protein